MKNIKFKVITIFLVQLSLLLNACEGKIENLIEHNLLDSTELLWISTVKYQDPSTQIYVGSPSLVRLDDGSILVSHDYFGPNRPRDDRGRSNRTSVYRSEDNGSTWQHQTDIDGIYWATLFLHKGDAYLLGTSAANASIAIIKSTDQGLTWTTAVDGTTGLLFAEGTNGQAPRYHCAPTPVLEHNGRLYKAFENIEDNTLPGFRGHKAFMISIDADDDLLVASNWTKSNELAFDGGWDPPGSNQTTGWLEGNAVVDTDGQVWDLLRVNSTPFHSRSAMIKITANGQTASFTPDDFIQFPGGQCKFVIRQDPQTGIYWAMLNATPTNAVQRNILELHASRNLKDWYFAKTLMIDDQGLSEEESIQLTGFQYPDWQFDGEHLIYLSRTAYGPGVPRAHDSNRITFGRVVNYRDFTPSELQ